MSKAGWEVEGIEFSESAAARVRAAGYRVGRVRSRRRPDP